MDTLRVVVLVVSIYGATGNQGDHFCNSYCTRGGELVQAKHCVAKYCCGDEWSRYCCRDVADAVTNNVERLVCTNTWWLFNWQMALGMLGIVVILLAVSACCCQCVSHTSSRQQMLRSRRGRNVGVLDISEMTCHDPVFNPQSMFAFVPPEYAKDPPKYQDVFGGASGETNAAFMPDNEASVQATSLSNHRESRSQINHHDNQWENHFPLSPPAYRPPSAVGPAETEMEAQVPVHVHPDGRLSIHAEHEMGGVYSICDGVGVANYPVASPWQRHTEGVQSTQSLVAAQSDDVTSALPRVVSSSGNIL